MSQPVQLALFNGWTLTLVDIRGLATGVLVKKYTFVLAPQHLHHRHRHHRLQDQNDHVN